MGSCIAMLTLASVPVLAQQHELAFTLGGLLSHDRDAVNLGSGTALEANYGYRLLDLKIASLYGEIHFLANPQRQITASNLSVTRDLATLYITPGVRLKFLAGPRLSPYLAVGGGYALYEQSTTLLNGAANPAPRDLNRGALDYGAGLDYRVFKWLAFRGEIRDFYTGSPAYNLRSIGGQHNVVTGGGFVLRR